MDDVKKTADELIVLTKPVPFYNIRASYQDFERVSDEEMTVLLQSPLVDMRGG